MGRFFYTPALPFMMAALQWGSGPGSWIATLNCLGYFIGTLAVACGWVEPNRLVFRLNLIVSTLGLAAVALTPHLIWQGSMVFGGVNFGTLVSGAIVLAAGSYADWRQLWLICADMSAIFTISAWTWPIPAWVRPNTTLAEAADPTETSVLADASSSFEANRRRATALLSTGYLFQGGGYIIIGTLTGNIEN